MIMANLAIKGHATRGKEVIQLLEMLGGKNIQKHCGDYTSAYYYIDNSCSWIRCETEIKQQNYTIFLLEEFENKFPYKVGDEVILKRSNKKAIIDKVTWCCDTITYWIKYDGYIEGNWRVDNLQPYKEQETMKENNLYKKLDFTQGLSSEKVELILGDYEVKEENGKTYLVKKQPQYPKTYEECCKVLGYDDRWAKDENGYSIYGYKSDILRILQQILICRDAYWKIAGDWKPEFRFGKNKYCIMTKYNQVITALVEETNRILTFPTLEMREAFYENFKERIELCKELL